MSKSNIEETYLLKKVGRHWLIGAEGRFKRVPVLTNAKEVEISDNYLIADDDIYGIQRNEAGEVTLVKIDDVPIYGSQQNNENVDKNANSSKQEASVDSELVFREEYNLSDRSGILEIKKKDNTDDWREDTTSETGPGEEYVDELELGQTEDYNQSLEAAGHTEETSYIETIPVIETTKDFEYDHASPQHKPYRFSRQFSLLSHTKGLQVFETTEKITVKVYSADILSVPVDCIVNAANIGLNHGGGIARAIEKAAGKDLTKDGCDYLKRHGKLKVGEACSTGAGKMNYECVIHVVGPCWSDYKPYSLRNVERCETDLYNAVINSLAEADRRKMETIAVSSISSGNYGCPQDLCSVQYAKAVLDHSAVSKSSLKEIHFVDTNMEMVNNMKITFQSMIPGDNVPKAYNKLRYVKSEDAANERYVDRNRESASGMKSYSGQFSVKTSEVYRKNSHGKSSQSKTECKFPIPEGYSAEFIQICCEDKLDRLKKSECEISFSKDTLIVKCPPDVVEAAESIMIDEFRKMKAEYPSWEILDLSQSDFKQNDVMRKLEEVKKSWNVECVMNSMKTKVFFFGKKTSDLKAAKDSVVHLLFLPRNITDPNSPKVVKEMGDAGSQDKPQRISRKFSWSTRAKGLQVFATTEKITVKVYSADILSVPVDCFVNPANVGLNHGGGIAKSIEEAAGKDLTKDGRDYLKQRGKLKVGEACSTSAGKMNYECVIHAVGPCWSEYKPYSLRNVERCETDLYNAIINSLAEADKRKMETIAISSINSGIYGCPLDLCSVQYAKAVLDHSALSKSSLKEIHFVDTNMEMVDTMQTTFQSMIPGDKVPISYNKLKYVKSEDAANRRDFAVKTPRNVWTDEGQSASKMPDKDNTYQSRHSPGGDSSLVVYPFYHQDHPPGHKKKEFACCFGVGQNLYIYTADILSEKDIDMVVCGNIPNGKSEGKLNKAIAERGGFTYKTFKKAAFKKDAAFGEVVMCLSGDMKNITWVGHAILCKDEHTRSRKEKVSSVFMKIFATLQGKQCHSLAIPLIGTGKGKGDPSFYAERFIDALLCFCLNNKTYQFRIHLIDKETEKTKAAVNAVIKAVQDARPLSVKMKKPQGIPSAQNAAIRPCSSGRQPPNYEYTRDPAHQYNVKEGGGRGNGGPGHESRKEEIYRNKDYNNRKRYQNRSQSPEMRKPWEIWKYV